jgi:hypothetical protein
MLKEIQEFDTVWFFHACFELLKFSYHDTNKLCQIYAFYLFYCAKK